MRASMDSPDAVALGTRSRSTNSGWLDLGYEQARIFLHQGHPQTPLDRGPGWLFVDLAYPQNANLLAPRAVQIEPQTFSLPWIAARFRGVVSSWILVLATTGAVLSALLASVGQPIWSAIATAPRCSPPAARLVTRAWAPGALTAVFTPIRSPTS
jgi:hypothetical protein